MGSMLTGYRVLDLTDEKGLLCARLLGDLGADIIKIEKPGGDKTRRRGPFYKDIPDTEKSLYWFFYNFNKRGITLDIESREGREILLQLVEKADFVVESYPSGHLDKLDLGYQTLQNRNSGIILISITAFGQDGPHKDYKTTDLIAASAAGLTYILGDDDRPPVRITAEQSYCQTGSHGAVAALMALYYRGITGKGQHVDVSIQEVMTWPLCYTIPFWDCNKQIWTRSGGYQRRSGVNTKMLFRCKDGFINYRIGVASIWGRSQKNLVKTMNREGYGLELKDIDWSSIGFEELTQGDHDRWLEPIEKYFLKHTRKELYELSQKNNFQLAPVNSLKDVYEHDQLAYRKYWARIDHHELEDTISYPGAFYKSNETEVEFRCRAPLIGEHNKNIYQDELGLSAEKLLKLERKNII